MEKVGRGFRHKFLVKWVGYQTPTWNNAREMEETEALDEWEARKASQEGGIEAETGPEDRITQEPTLQGEPTHTRGARRWGRRRGVV